MLVVLRESVWNASEDTGYTLNVSTAHFATPRSLGDISSRTANVTPRRVQFSSVSSIHADVSSPLPPKDLQKQHGEIEQPLELSDMGKNVKSPQLLHEHPDF